MYPSTTPHLWRINRLAHRIFVVNLRNWQVLMIYWTNLTRKLTGMKRGLTISHGGATTNVQKRNLSKKPPSVIADVRPSGSAGDSATARLWIFLFRLFAVRACACLGERSEPTCIRQAHARVPKGNFTRGSGRTAQDYILPLLSLK